MCSRQQKNLSITLRTFMGTTSTFLLIHREGEKRQFHRPLHKSTALNPLLQMVALYWIHRSDNKTERNKHNRMQTKEIDHEKKNYDPDSSL